MIISTLENDRKPTLGWETRFDNPAASQQFFFPLFTFKSPHTTHSHFVCFLPGFALIEDGLLESMDLAAQARKHRHGVGIGDRCIAPLHAWKIAAEAQSQADTCQFFKK
ncbi:hypothetical protein ACLOJK_023209 [Asimina triloba]